MTPLSICLLEPFYGGSHKRWADELKAFSSHQIDLLTLPDHHWKWRMHGGAVSFSNQLLASEKHYDLILANDMMDVAVFAGLIRKRFPNTPIATYFHENQLCYPWSPRDKDARTGKDLHYAYINYTSALASDHVFFNSDYHKTVFLEALPPFLARYPDHQNKDTVQSIAAKSQTLALGMDLRSFDPFRPESKTSANTRPLLLWNHRWEYDKNPIGFFRIINSLLAKGLDFDLALLGERFDEEPPYFKKAKATLGSRIVQYGREPDFAKYAAWLWKADIYPVSSIQDFFGGSVVEAIHCGCHPVLPNRLAYPGHLDDSGCFYEDEDQAVLRLTELIQSGEWKTRFQAPEKISRYDWSKAISVYDGRLQETARI